jgi:predicted secreted protein
MPPMGPFEVIVVFVITWWLSFLPILTMGTQSQKEAGSVIPGTEEAAPVTPGIKKKVWIATAVAAGVSVVAFVWSRLAAG